MSDKNRLGRGLGAIFGDDISSALEDIQKGTGSDFGGVKTRLSVDIIRTNPYQPRRNFDEDKLEELATSIKTHGLFTPILVRETNKGYELVAGERRLRASKLAGMEEISAIVVEFDDSEMMEIAVIENVQREDLDVIEEASAYKLLIDRLDLTQEDVAKRMSKSRSHVANLLRLLKLPASVQAMVSEKKLSMGHVRPLITLEDDREIESIAREIFEKKLSVRETEKLIQMRNEPETTPKEKTTEDTSKFEYVVNLMENKLQTRINIKSKQVNIHFTDDEDLNRILELLNLID